MNVGKILLALTWVPAVFSALVAIAWRSFKRNFALYDRSVWISAAIALAAVFVWPWTLFWWVLGPTPERQFKERYGRSWKVTRDGPDRRKGG